MNTLLKRFAEGTALALVAGLAGTAWGAGPCDFVTTSEASRLLGVSAVKKTVQSTASPDASACLIRGAHGSRETLTLVMTTIARKDVRFLTHLDDERGEAVPSRHGEPWYEVSVPDAQHPENRRIVIHRDRTDLTIDLHSARQSDAKRAFEDVWYKIADRLPYDER